MFRLSMILCLYIYFPYALVLDLYIIYIYIILYSCFIVVIHPIPGGRIDEEFLEILFNFCENMLCPCAEYVQPNSELGDCLC